ncbi:MAG: hypothetical protein GTO51_03855 [Candidatus Latescibacteria bacterium]|nr:hypothetical protein [Candidatus Latescibacterota bacterium]NIM20974.1 hypothetical protein [Candidatus Latescibacterota bacterium]NIM65109.1 hypothetical protein [Candidatus Latescibacterota bacterium]NIO01624.1 hypothetical protein [Candidatus Latescibacterota bacterium]NIO28141.1 hypothetical protein [Candidatus Latescibacterota bacterium]
MGRPEIKVPSLPFVYGGEAEMLCRECQLPCKLDVMSIDCYRRFFLQGMLQCTYFIYGYCFLVEKPGCVFDNGGQHEDYWLRLLNDYFHNVKNVEETDPDFARNSEELKKLVFTQIENRQVSLCRYIEETYNRVMETGGGLSEEMMEKLDEAYLALLGGTSRKK